MEFTGEIAEIQQRLAARRHAVLQELAPRRGERVVEVGCGAGLLLRDIGLALGPHGLAAGVDISPRPGLAIFAPCRCRSSTRTCTKTPSPGGSPG